MRSRSLNRSAFRTLTRFTARLTPGARRRRDLVIGLRHLSAAVRSWRRLIRLAPSLYDNAVVDRERREAAERAARLAEIHEALVRVYGTDEAASLSTQKPLASKGEEKVNLDPVHDAFCRLPRTRKSAIIQEEVRYKFHLAASHEAMERWKKLRPHDLMTLNQMTRFVDLAFTFGRIAVGLPI